MSESIKNSFPTSLKVKFVREKTQQFVFFELDLNGHVFYSGKASANGSVPKAIKSPEQHTSGGDALAKEFLVVSKNVSFIP